MFSAFMFGVWRLDEDGVFCVFDSGKEGGVLGSVDACVIWCWTLLGHLVSISFAPVWLLTSPWFSVYQGHWEWLVWW